MINKVVKHKEVRHCKGSSSSAL